MKIRLASIFALAIFATHAHAADLSIKPGDQVVRVDVQTKNQLDLLEAMDLDIWSHEVGIGPIDVHVTPADAVNLEKAGLAYKVLNGDLARSYIDEKAQYLATRGLATPFDSYLPLADLTTFINNMAVDRPDLCSVIDIGNSIQGRDIWVLKITGAGAGPKPAVFYHALQHAREWITAPVALYLANYLVQNYDTDPCVRALVDQSEIYISPCVNPDGYSYSWTNTRLWRKNRRANAGGTFGVDLNRNWSYGWGGGGSSGTPSSETYRGTAAFSEPETQALSNFILANTNIRGYMDYHSYSQLILWPFGNVCSEPPEPDRSKFLMLGNRMQQLIEQEHASYYEPGPICLTLYQASGGSVDYVYGTAGRTGFTIELRDTGQFGFELPAAQITPTCEENLPAILYLTRWATSGIQLELADEVPSQLAANVPTNINVTIAPSIETYVAGTGEMRYRVLPSGSFTSVPLASQGGDNYSATMPGLTCGDTIEYYFTATGSGGYVSRQPCDAPTSVYTATVVASIPTPQVVQQFNMNSNPGWTTMGQWAYGTPAGLSGDPASGFTGSNVYGFNLSGDYTDNMASTQYLTTTPIDCSGLVGTQLRFRRWLGVESSQWDHASIQVSNNGSTWTTVWDFSGASLNEAAWSLQTYEIGGAADGQSSVQIRWGMGPTDTSVVYHGWNIDDVEILGMPLDPCIGVMLGDVNGDTLVNGDDVDDFVDVVLNPGLATQAEKCAADIDTVCGAEVLDIESFVILLLGV